ncbi:DUF1365 domain-containing protein [Sciscionella marina]|uniref:DUF1365 domain-containing protein n=1 Tax=Sciscionella marina TaxID=508770 RepID=UPI00036BBA8C|nr:DUF1365 domain-containing protein [Sciscionella marina]
MSAALYAVRVRHVRADRIRTMFDHDFYLWLVDLDRMPRPSRWLRPFARFDARDHGAGDAVAGDQGAAIRAELEEWLAAREVPAPSGRITMLASARVLGYVFNPLSVFWCHDAEGSVTHVVAEVHNTYRERHRYLLYPDARGQATAAKTFYVSPFLAMGGHYRMRLPEPDETLRLSVVLEQHGDRPLVATMHGRRLPGENRALLRMLLRHPLAPLHVSAAIRRRGIALWLRGVPRTPRDVNTSTPRRR